MKSTTASAFTAALLGLLLLTEGRATYYAPGVMEQVVAYRTRIGQLAPCPECIGYVALLDAEHIGRRVWLQRAGQPVEGPFLVADCAQAGHRANLTARGWAVDVDWQTAQRWRMRGPVAGVRVWLEAEVDHD